MISVVFGYRNRDTLRVKRCLDSLEKQTYKDFEVIFVDYGSDSAIASEVRALVESYSFTKYIYSDSRGRLWSRSIALNIGIKAACGDYIFTNDIDMLFPSKVLEQLSEEVEPDSVCHVRSNFLSEIFNNFDKVDEIPLGKYDGSGRGIMVIPRKYLMEMRGYDEFYFYWGSEDRDLSSRLKCVDLHEKEISDNIYLHHQWHPASYDTQQEFIPRNLEGRMENYRRRNEGKVMRNHNSWGEVIEADNRKCWQYLDAETLSFRDQQSLKLFDKYPSEYFVQSWLADFFHDAESGSQIVVANLAYPKKNKTLTRIFNFLNRELFNKLKLQFGLYYARNQLASMIYDFVQENQDLIEDYYLDLPYYGGSIWILKK